MENDDSHNEIVDLIKNLEKKIEYIEDRLEKRIDRLEQMLYERERYRPPIEHPYKLKPKFPPFFVKGHDLPIVVPKRPIDPIKGRFLTLKVLYEMKRPVSIEEICKKTCRSRSLEVNYLNRLEEMGFVEKIPKGKKMLYKITKDGENFIKILV